MTRTMKRLVAVALSTTALVAATNADAAVVFDISQVGANVVVTASGTFDNNTLGGRGLTAGVYSFSAGTNLITVDIGQSAVVPAAAGAVPEPATWGLMLAGFGLVGAALRRRSTRVAFA